MDEAIFSSMKIKVIILLGLSVLMLGAKPRGGPTRDAENAAIAKFEESWTPHEHNETKEKVWIAAYRADAKAQEIYLIVSQFNCNAVAKQLSDPEKEVFSQYGAVPEWSGIATIKFEEIMPHDKYLWRKTKVPSHLRYQYSATDHQFDNLAPDYFCVRSKDKWFVVLREPKRSESIRRMSDEEINKVLYGRAGG